MRLHIIIPTLNEADNLRELLPVLRSELAGKGKITVADGGSSDDTRQVLAQYPDVELLSCQTCGRAPQMNEAAERGLDDFDALYFVHADTRPPRGFYQDIRTSIAEGYPVGCYRFRFDMWHPLLAINAFFTRFRGLACRGGDQSLYLTQEAYRRLGGFRDMRIMEDYDIIQRVWANEVPFRIMPRAITVSARKYRVNGWYRVQMANLKVFRMYKAGAPEEAMIRCYRERLDPW
ncbi:glycosyltransferase family 2 protein [Neolewinella lacunae]|uniref:Glycosyltransferase family 2 protein n=1 Tax=Neolewinella lacunae TaxID=1517758 RepID=A0A923T8L9_9BACT|nr:glycosyltransferase family 2 protein [Neolewinella lacunae]MBC6995770.1 glycosyltransferase family 2 protein [Neolewinella lacunae]MDN3636537.1 glycosyltransferase family 2 protein [Neolewinella lacunae]